MYFWGFAVSPFLYLEKHRSFESAQGLTKSDFREPVNIGSDEMVSMNEMAEIVLSFENKKLPIHHIPGPEGVRGRNSDNALIKEKLGWAPTMRLKDGLRITYFWIKKQSRKRRRRALTCQFMGHQKWLTHKHQFNSAHFVQVMGKNDVGAEHHLTI